MRKVSCDLTDGGEYTESFGLSTLSTDNMRKVSCDLTDGGEYTESFGLSTLSTDNMRKVSCDLADGGEYTESFGLFTLVGAICGNYLSNKIVRPLVFYRWSQAIPKYIRTTH
jgi:hypothetical protein